jgi:hypothetical protein
MKALLREPLVHFLLLGAALFGLSYLVGSPAATPAGANRIVITPAIINNLQVSFNRSAAHDPSPAELDNLIEDYVREEVLNREARALGLDVDDPLVRRQLRRRMEFLSEDTVENLAPTEDELKAFVAKNPKPFLDPAGKLPEFAQLADQAKAAWLNARRQEADDADYAKRRAHYTIVIEKPAASTNAASKP